MVPKNMLKFLRGPIHKIPCYELDCKIVLHTRAYNKKYCKKHRGQSGRSRQYKHVKKRQTDLQSPYSKYQKFEETTKRQCLKCEKSFSSIGKFNRLCHLCNQDNDTVGKSVNYVGVDSYADYEREDMYGV